MTEVVTQSNDNSSSNESAITNVISSPKLWAGKYKSAEDMEVAIINKDKEYSKLSTEYSALKDTHETITKVPEHYDTITLDLRAEEMADIQQISKNAGLTQSQFERTAKEMESRIKQQRHAFEESKQAIGDERLTVLQDYVKKTYPESLQPVVLQQIIKDKNAMSDALKHRDELLNSQVPGINNAGGTGTKTYDGQTEVLKAANEYRRNPTEKNRDKYINLATEVANQRFKDKNV